MKAHSGTTIRLLAAALVGVVASTTATIRAQAPPPGSGPLDLTGYIRIIDGDTIETTINGRRSGIGIIGIRAPMANTACGKAATGFLRGLVASGRIRLDEDPNIAYDVRQRRMYYAQLPDFSSVAVAMARAGFALPSGEGVETNQITAAAAGAAAAGSGCAARR
jgi:endonuclease YncB( thermonuclease family)